MRLTHCWPAPLILALAAMSSGCSHFKPAAGSGKPATEQSLAALENVDLNCVRLVDDGTAAKLPPDAGITFRITGPGKVAGRAAVNRYFGGYTLVGPGAVTWTPFGSTRMAGPPERMILENQFLQTLPKTTQADTTANGLIFQSADGRNVVEFRR
ncbi:MAG: META domain-containing protein [Verrucomicrobia bacterium]|nr:META domain-containing protein [Verrucomicrobiota bacterium]